LTSIKKCVIIWSQSKRKAQKRKNEVKKMKLATNKWNVRITINGKVGTPFYYGFKTKREAQAEADRWLAKGFEAEVIKY
jgi:hypothetical protein